MMDDIILICSNKKKGFGDLILNAVEKQQLNANSEVEKIDYVIQLTSREKSSCGRPAQGTKVHMGAWFWSLAESPGKNKSVGSQELEYFDEKNSVLFYQGDKKGRLECGNTSQNDKTSASEKTTSNSE